MTTLPQITEIKQALEAGTEEMFILGLLRAARLDADLTEANVIAAGWALYKEQRKRQRIAEGKK